MRLNSRINCKLCYCCVTVITILVNSVLSSYSYGNNITNKFINHKNDYVQVDVRKMDKTRLREPKFISFETRDNNIEVRFVHDVKF